MKELVEISPWLALMGVLACGSCFFSLSEAALFALDQRSREELAERDRRGKIIARLLGESEELLTAILLWNLFFNIAYFSVSAIVSLALQRRGAAGWAGAFGVGSLFGLIVFCEMLPKSLGVSHPRFWSLLLAGPLAMAVDAVRQFLHPLRRLSRWTLRVVWPTFRPEPYLQVGDVERAVEWSIVNRLLLSEEEAVLQSLVALSDIRADELMRPRKQLPLLRPPIRWADLGPELLRGGVIYVADCNTDEPVAILPLKSFCGRKEEPLERWAYPLLPVPWCISAAEVFQRLVSQGFIAAAVLNEYGETIGVLTLEELFRAALTLGSGPPDRPLQREPIRYLGGQRWQVTGSTALRRLAKHFRIPRPSSRCVSVGGLLQECLGRLPQQGDECQAGCLHLRVVDTSPDGDLLIELAFLPDKEHGKP